MVDSLKIEGTIDFKIYKKMDTGLKMFVLRALTFLKLHVLKALFLERYGEVRDAWSVHNLVTNGGKAGAAGLLINVGAVTAPSYLELGTSNTAVTAAQTALQAAITDSGLARAASTASRVTTSVTNDTAQLLHQWTASGAKTIEEIGIFNAASSGLMFTRALTGSKAIVSGETITATYKVQMV